MSKKNICYLLLYISLLSCTNNKDKSTSVQHRDLITIKNITIKPDSLILSPYIITSIDNNIITRIFSQEYLFYAYKVSDNNIKLSASFGKAGGGPNEIIGRPELYYNEKDKSLHVFDISGGNNISYYILKEDTLVKFRDNLNWNKKRFPKLSESVWSKIIPLSDSIFIGLGGNIQQDNLLTEINSNTETTNNINVDFPSDGIKADVIVKRYVYNDANLLKRPSSNQYLYYCRNWGNYAEIINLDDNNRLKERKVLFTDYPSYTTASDGVNRESLPDNLLGMYAFSTNKYIYILPNFTRKKDRDQESINGYPNGYTDLLYVYNWDGTHIKTYKLTKPIKHFIVDSEDNYIVGISIESSSGDYTFEKYLLN